MGNCQQWKRAEIFNKVHVSAQISCVRNPYNNNVFSGRFVGSSIWDSTRGVLPASMPYLSQIRFPWRRHARIALPSYARDSRNVGCGNVVRSRGW